MMISVTILTQNSERYLPEVLGALEAFDEVLLLDGGSTDNTLSIAKKYPNVSVYNHTFDSFGPSHNRATALAKNDWILSVDSDEVVLPSLSEEIKRLSLDSNTVYAVARNNYYRGQLIKGCGWSPDYQWRLYNRKKTRFTDAKVHEGVITEEMQCKKLQGALKHYSYDSTEEFLKKMQTYSTLFAEQYKGKKRSSLCKALLHGFFAFFKSYIIKRGVFDGGKGFIISLYNGNTAFYKYLKLAETSQERRL